MRLAATLLVLAAALPAADDLWSPVKAIINDRCIDCHGPKKAKKGLRLDSAEAIAKGSKDGPVIEAGKPDKSEFYTLTLLPADNEDKMPPKGERLTKVQTDAIKAWIEAGAVVPKDAAK